MTIDVTVSGGADTRVDVADSGTLVVPDATEINFDTDITVTDDGDGSVTVGASVSNISEFEAIIYLDGSDTVALDGGDGSELDRDTNAFVVLKTALSNADSVFVKPAAYTGDLSAVDFSTVDHGGKYIIGTCSGFDTADNDPLDFNPPHPPREPYFEDTSGTFPVLFQDSAVDGFVLQGLGFRNIGEVVQFNAVDNGGIGVDEINQNLVFRELYPSEVGSLIHVEDPLFWTADRLVAVGTYSIIWYQSVTAVNTGNAYWTDFYIEGDGAPNISSSKYGGGPVSFDGAKNVNYIYFSKYQAIGSSSFAQLDFRDGSNVTECEFVGVDNEGFGKALWVESGATLSESEIEYQTQGNTIEVKSDANGFNNNEITVRRNRDTITSQDDALMSDNIIKTWDSAISATDRVPGNIYLHEGRPYVHTVTGAYSVAGEDTILADASGGTFAVTLEPAREGTSVTIKKIDSTGNAVDIETPNTETIDGQPSLSLTSQYTSRTITTDGTNYYIK